jgi:hypothetical protein
MTASRTRLPVVAAPSRNARQRIKTARGTMPMTASMSAEADPE